MGEDKQMLAAGLKCIDNSSLIYLSVIVAISNNNYNLLSTDIEQVLSKHYIISFLRSWETSKESKDETCRPINKTCAQIQGKVQTPIERNRECATVSWGGISPV